MENNPLSAQSLGMNLNLDSKKWDSVASPIQVEQTVKTLEAKGIRVMLVKSKKEALEAIQTIIPKGAEIMNGSSTTLIEIGFTDFLKSGKHEWVNRHDKVLAENDWPKKAEIYRHATTSEYFLSGVNAISQTGELVACDASGTRTGAWLFAAQHLVLVAGTNKIVPTLDAALERVRHFALPLEDARAKIVYGMGSRTAKWAVLESDNPGRTTLILVEERLGF